MILVRKSIFESEPWPYSGEVKQLNLSGKVCWCCWQLVGILLNEVIKVPASTRKLQSCRHQEL